MEPIKGLPTVTSVSGGKTSAYLAANFPSERNVFALVRTMDESCKYPDKKLRQEVEDRIQAPFVGTLEDDIIIHTILDLEQFLGAKIDWTTGIPFEEVVRDKGGWLPNKLHRYCTSEMKLTPIFHWWYDNYHPQGCEFRIGFRANETDRAKKSMAKHGKSGFLEMKASVEKMDDGSGRKKWDYFPWQRHRYPLIEEGVFRDAIEEFWKDKPVRFAPYNNCVGCFHRPPIMLRKIKDWHPNKFEWFAKQERSGRKGQWRSDLSYDEIGKHRLQVELTFDDFNDCDTGYCGL